MHRRLRSHRPHRWLTPLLIVLIALAGPLTIGRAGAQESELTEQLNNIEDDTAEIRGLEELTEIEEGFLNRDELRTDLEADFDKDYPPDALAADEQFLKALGLMPADADLRTIYLDLYTEQVGGFYDPETDELYVIADDDELDAMEQLIYAHEVTHALQDQHFDLMGLREPYFANDDALLAITALIEGDATAVMTDYLSEHPRLALDLAGDMLTGGASTDVLDSAPPIISAQLLFPYEAGLTFVTELRASAGGYVGVDAAFGDLPLTTEQIMHPEKYVEERDTPVELTVPDISSVLGADWQLTDANNFGEFGMSVMLAEQDGEAAAAGWDGDQYAFYDNGDESVVVWQSAWDSVEDATEFVASLQTYDEGRLDAEFSEEGDTLTLSGDGIAVRIVQRGDRVDYVLAPSTDLLDAVSGALGD